MNTRLEAATEYDARGWAPLPIPYKEKNPGFKKWQKYRAENGQLEKDFQGNGNIGLLLGKPSQGLVDVDCDWSESRILAPKFLPKTGMMHERDGSPKSHFWFLSDVPKTIQYRDPNFAETDDRSMIIELRSTGGQTVVPPSVHESGETLRWVGELDPASVDARQLNSAVAKVAAGSLLARYWQRTGKRHDSALALAGTLFRNGWTRKEVDHFILSIVEVSGDDEPNDRKRAIADTEEKIRNGLEATGIPTLVELFGDKTINKLIKWLDLRPQGSRLRAALNEPIELETETEAEDGDNPQPDKSSNRITLHPSGRGKTSVCVFIKDVLVFQDSIVLNSHEHRARFLRELAKRAALTGDQLQTIEVALLQKAKETEEAAREDAKTRSKKIYQPNEIYCPYRATEEGLIWDKPVNGSGEKDGLTVPVTIANFTAEIIGDVIRDDGTEPEHNFELAVKICGSNQIYTGLVRAQDYPLMRWPVAIAGPEAIIYASKADHVRTGVQALSLGKTTRRRVITHTGWRHFNGRWVFYHGGGAIGEEGLIEADVDLPPSLTPCVLPAPPTGDRLRDVVRAVLYDLPKVAPDMIMLPLIGCVPVAILTGADFSLFLLGITGKGKTAVYLLVQGFFGASFNEETIPANWGSTPLSIQEVAHMAKDIVCGVDDFLPKGTQIEKAKMHAKAETVLRGQANRSGRGRCRPDGSIRPERPPRGMIVATGEDLPHGQSLIARLVGVEVKDGDIDWDQLTVCQNQSREGVYAEVCSAFVQWLATGNRLETLKNEARGKIHELRLKWASSGIDSHKKTANSLAQLERAWGVWLDFALDCGAIDDEERTGLREAMLEALDTIGRAQSRFLASENPAPRFIDLLKSALSSGRAHLCSVNGDKPVANLAACGWRYKEISTENGPSHVWNSMGELIGWIDDDDIYLQPDSAYRIAQSVAASGEELPVSSRALWKCLKEEGWLATWDAARERNYIRRTICGTEEKVIHIRAKKFFTGGTP